MAYCCYKTQFGSEITTTMTGSIRENRATEKDGYLLDSLISQFLVNHKASDFDVYVATEKEYQEWLLTKKS